MSLPRSVTRASQSPIEMFDPATGVCSPWPSELSDKNGSRWRQKSGGKPVYAVPLRCYCGDASGNKPKKWNKHNSWLFTLAALPRREASGDSNVRFLCVSNLAPPLEMLDGIADQIQYVLFIAAVLHAI